MNPAELNLEIYQGSTWDQEFFIVLDPDNNVMDLYGKKLRMKVKGCYSSTSEQLNMTTENGRIILNSGDWKGTWDVATPYVIDDIVVHNITIDGTSYDLYFICLEGNTGEKPEFNGTQYWTIYKQIQFNVNAEETAELIPGNYKHDLEIYDDDVSPIVVNKMFYGDFKINAEATT